jgi:hypothetical protein
LFPGAFGGATIRDPWEVLAEYKELLEGPEYQCDIVIPLQHTYVPDDHRTCQEFDFPVVLSGHDHHCVDEIVQGMRLLKPGLDAIYATILELSWLNGTSPKKLPEVSATFVRCSDWQPDLVLEEENERAYNALTPLRNTELAQVPPAFEPLSSTNSRGKVTSMAENVSARWYPRDIRDMVCPHPSVTSCYDTPVRKQNPLNKCDKSASRSKLNTAMPTLRTTKI